MSKRLQVVMDEDEYREIREAAEQRRLTVSEWVRRTLRRARESEPSTDIGSKLEVVRSAVRYDFPTADVAQMLREIEASYGAGSETGESEAEESGGGGSGPESSS
ncbi:MAG: hypothetical protein R6U63_09360 [Longimicrobiales bacterium]